MGEKEKEHLKSMYKEAQLQTIMDIASNRKAIAKLFFYSILFFQTQDKNTQRYFSTEKNEKQF